MLYTTGTVPKDSSGYSWSAYLHLLLWIFASYANQRCAMRKIRSWYCSAKEGRSGGGFDALPHTGRVCERHCSCRDSHNRDLRARFLLLWNNSKLLRALGRPRHRHHAHHRASGMQTNQRAIHFHRNMAGAARSSRPGGEVRSGSDAGFASRCKKEGNCERAQSGTITFDRYEEGSGASGRYELRFKGEETLSGTFDVKWCQDRVICG